MHVVQTIMRDWKIRWFGEQNCRLTFIYCRVSKEISNCKRSEGINESKIRRWIEGEKSGAKFRKLKTRLKGKKARVTAKIQECFTVASVKDAGSGCLLGARTMPRKKPLREADAATATMKTTAPMKDQYAARKSIAPKTEQLSCGFGWLPFHTENTGDT